MSRYAKAVDANQRSIVQMLRAIGATVLDLSQVGGGCPDILVGFRGQNYLIEIKTARGKTNPLQNYFIEQWNGRTPKVARSFDEVCEIIGAQFA